MNKINFHGDFSATQRTVGTQVHTGTQQKHPFLCQSLTRPRLSTRAAQVHRYTQRRRTDRSALARSGSLRFPSVPFGSLWWGWDAYKKNQNAQASLSPVTGLIQPVCLFTSHTRHRITPPPCFVANNTSRAGQTIDSSHRERERAQLTQWVHVGDNNGPLLQQKGRVGSPQNFKDCLPVGLDVDVWRADPETTVKIPRGIFSAT